MRNIDYIVDSYKQRIFSNDKIAEALSSNPQFKSVVEKSCRTLAESINGIGCDIKVSDDGKTIIMMAEGKWDKTREELRDNIAMHVTTISLEGDSMVVDNSFGWLDSTESLKKIGVEIGSEYSCALSTSYEHSIFDKDGIEMSRSSFSDPSYFLTGEYSAYQLRQQLLSDLHKPSFSFNCFPGRPRFCNDATASCMYRNYDNLGLAYVNKATNIKTYGGNQKNEVTLCEVATEYPEYLRVFTHYPAASYDFTKHEYVINSDYDLTSKDISEMQENIRRRFAAGLESSKTKEYTPEMYQRLLSHTEQSKTL